MVWHLSFRIEGRQCYCSELYVPPVSETEDDFLLTDPWIVTAAPCCISGMSPIKAMLPCRACKYVALGFMQGVAFGLLSRRPARIN